MREIGPDLGNHRPPTRLPTIADVTIGLVNSSGCDGLFPPPLLHHGDFLTLSLSLLNLGKIFNLKTNF